MERGGKGERRKEERKKGGNIKLTGVVRPPAELRPTSTLDTSELIDRPVTNELKRRKGRDVVGMTENINQLKALHLCRS